MKIFRGFESARGIKNPVVTTGSFDGVHAGHKTILKRLQNLAEKTGGESVLITFEPHPRKVLYPDTGGKDLKLICSQEEKLELLRKTGLDNVIIVNFTLEFSRTTSEQFVSEYLHDILHARVVVAGFNHHFGFNKEGDYKHLWAWQDKYNFTAEEIPEQEVHHETVSSTRIRQAISEGYIQRANAYLDDYYMVMGKAVPSGISSQVTSGILRIPLTEPFKLLPPSGIYAVSVRRESLYSRGMVIIHRNSSDETEVLLDIFDPGSFPLEKTLSVFFHKKIRGSVDILTDTSSAVIRRAKDEISDLIF
ncbi:MAG TPA: hypothetical protein VJ963_10400 [Bacteroidales bacterium]|nr:hypothetical protein [Bacteroidales bacterium]